MRRSRSVCLVLLAGGVALSLAGGCEDRRVRECREAREQLRPDAEQICARSTSSGYRSSGGSSSWFFGRSHGDARSGQAFAGRAGAPAASSRGGFGASAHSAGS